MRALNKSVLGLFFTLAGCGQQLVEFGNPTVPLGSSTDPPNNSTGVATNKQVSAVFSRAMDPASITGTTFTLKQGTTAIGGAVSYAGTTATFVPTSLLGTSSTYVASISTGAKDSAGLAIAAA